MIGTFFQFLGYMDTRSSRWAFTAFEAQWPLFDNMPPVVKDAGWQIEIAPDTQKKHYQGYLLTSSTQRFAAMRKLFPGVHLEVAKNWQALVAYCKKKETAVPGSQKEYHSTFMNKFQFMDYLCDRIVSEYVDHREREFEFLERQLIRLGNEYVLDGNTYAAWIMSDPNFKTTWRSSGRALLMAADGRTDAK